MKMGMEKASTQYRAKRKSVSQECLFDRKNKAVRADAERKYGGGGVVFFPHKQHGRYSVSGIGGKWVLTELTQWVCFRCLIFPFIYRSEFFLLLYIFTLYSTFLACTVKVMFPLFKTKVNDTAKIWLALLVRKNMAVSWLWYFPN
jgi:hypothetical protein